MLSRLLSSKAFQSAINAFWKENKESIIDIILFGSVMKGKEKPNDIDILLLTKGKMENDKVYQLRKKIED